MQKKYKRRTSLTSSHRSSARHTPFDKCLGDIPDKELQLLDNLLGLLTVLDHDTHILRQDVIWRHGQQSGIKLQQIAQRIGPCETTFRGLVVLNGRSPLFRDSAKVIYGHITHKGLAPDTLVQIQFLKLCHNPLLQHPLFALAQGRQLLGHNVGHGAPLLPTTFFALV